MRVYFLDRHQWPMNPLWRGPDISSKADSAAPGTTWQTRSDGQGQVAIIDAPR